MDEVLRFTIPNALFQDSTDFVFSFSMSNFLKTRTCYQKVMGSITMHIESPSVGRYYRYRVSEKYRDFLVSIRVSGFEYRKSIPKMH